MFDGRLECADEDDDDEDDEDGMWLFDDDTPLAPVLFPFPVPVSVPQYIMISPASS